MSDPIVCTYCGSTLEDLEIMVEKQISITLSWCDGVYCEDDQDVQQIKVVSMYCQTCKRYVELPKQTWLKYDSSDYTWVPVQEPQRLRSVS